MINIIGDSHVYRLKESKIVRAFWLEKPTTAHNLRKHKDELQKIISQYPDEKWWFWYGEVDARIHIYKVMQEQGITNLKIPVKNTCTRYLELVKELHNNVGVFALPPAGYEENIYDYEHFGKRPMRQTIINHMNAYLEFLSHTYGVDYADFLPELRSGSKYTMKLLPAEYFEDPAHIRGEILVEGIEKWATSVE